MDVLLLGGTEFVGKAYLEKLISNGFTVDFITRGFKPITTKGYRHHFKCDRRDENSLAKLLRNRAYDYIFDISAYTEEDIKPILNTIDRSRLKRYFLLSTGGVYAPSSSILSENDEIGFNKNWGTYGVDKRKVELLLIEEFKSKNLPILIFRPTYIYGEGNNLYRESYFFHRIIDQLPIPYPDTKQVKTQFIHIEDLIDITFEAIQKEATNGEAFNLTNPEMYTWKELLVNIKEITKIDVPILPVSEEMMNKLRVNSKDFFPFRDVNYLLSIQKLKNYKLPEPKITLKEGLERSYNWFNNQKIKRQYNLFCALDKVQF